METHLSAGDSHLNLTTGSRDNLAKFLNHAVQETQSVVLGEGVEEVLEGGTAGTGLLDELGHDGRSIGGGQGRGGEDGNQLGVLLDNGAELGELLGGGIEGGSLGGRGVLKIDARISHFRGGVFGVANSIDVCSIGTLRNWQLCHWRYQKEIFHDCSQEAFVPEQWRRCHRGQRQQWGP